jgi:branched-chain amino acid aminotransferase
MAVAPCHIHGYIRRTTFYQLSKSSSIGIRCINSAALTIERTANARLKTPKEQLQFGKTMSDHMLVIPWDRKNSWSVPKIIPYQNLSISPAACALHYGE